MSVFNSKVDLESDQFKQYSDDMLKLIEQRKRIMDRAKTKSNEKTPRFEQRGQLTPRQRLDALIDGYNPEKNINIKETININMMY